MNQSVRSLGKRAASRLALLLLVFGYAFSIAFWPPNAAAQATAQISGQVTDSTGAVIAAAQVQVTNTDTGGVRTTQTTDDGAFSLPSLAIGPYKLQVTKEGFQTFVQSGIILQVNSDPTIAVTLQVGSATQTVEVKANAAMVETQSNGVGQVIQPEQVIDLPLNGRQVTQLISLSGAAVNTGGAGGLAGSLDYEGPGGTGAVTFSVAGSQSNATNYFLDGSSNMDYRSDAGEPMPFPDALQEFKVESSALPADLGSHPGGAVSGVTKSGTNSFHGDGFEFLRNGIMDAASYNFPSTKGLITTKPSYDSLKRNQFGGVIGGPIKRDKLFFFYGFQGTTDRQTNPPAVRTQALPTANMLAGNFTAYLPGNPFGCKAFTLPSTVPSPTGGTQQFTTAPGSNILAPGWLDTPSHQIDQKIAALYPIPQNDSSCGTVTTTSYQHDHEFQHVIRTDWQRTANDTIFARYFTTNYLLQSTLSSPTNILSSSGVGLNDRVQNISIGDTHIVTPQMISSLRVSFLRTATQRTGNPNIPNLCTLGMTNASCPTPNIMQSLFLEPGNQGWDYENAFGISENLGWQIRSHQLELGFTGEHIQMNGNGTFQLNPLTGFSNAGYTGNSIVDFVAGMPDTMGQGNGQLSRDGQNLPSLYFQDNWKMTRTFQVNYGVRWDPYFPSHNRYGQAANFSLAGYNAGTVSRIFVNAPAGVTFPGDPGANGKSDTLNHALDFSPRLGIVWDPRGKGLETVRAGYGIFYDTSLMWNAMHVVLNAPWGNTVSFTPLPPLAGSTVASSGGGEANPYFGQPGGNIFPTPFYPPSNWNFPVNGGYVFQDQQLKPSNAQLWNLSFQKQISANWLVSASYLGSKTTHIWLGDDLNPAAVITAGMTAPAIVANNVVAGNPTSGSCTLRYNGANYTFNPCNAIASGSATVNGVPVSNTSARRALNLSNPAQGYKMSGGVLMAQSMGNAAYNGLLASVQHRLSQGFSINANYTWSHCLDDGEVGQDIADSFQNPANPKADWGNCGSDRRQIFNLSLVAQSPKLSSSWMNRILGNWNGSGIFTATTGSYSNVSDGSDVSLIGQRGVPGSGGFTDRPNQVGDPFMAGNLSGNSTCVGPTAVHTLLSWFNPCAFVKQPTATFGDTGRNTLLGAGHWNFDAAVWRTFVITERLKMDFRFEGFNVFNHPQFGNPNVSLASSSPLGYISSTSNSMRIMQAAVKFNF
jgi:hypothetical protein